MTSLLRPAAIVARCARSTSSRALVGTAPWAQASNMASKGFSTLSFDFAIRNEAAFKTETRQTTLWSGAMGDVSLMAAVKSSLSSALANLSGDTTLITVNNVTSNHDHRESDLSEEWEDVIMETPLATPMTSMLSENDLESLSIWQISTLKRRKKMMNKHKLRKRRKKLRLRTRK